MRVEFASVSARIAAPANTVWALLADFGRPQVLAPSIVGCTLTGDGVGAVRVVRSSRGLAIHERLLECDCENYRLRYEVLETGDMPFEHVASYVCTVTLNPIDEHITEITWRSEGCADGPVEPIRDFLTALYHGATASLESHARPRI